MKPRNIDKALYRGLVIEGLDVGNVKKMLFVKLTCYISHPHT